MQGQFFDTTDRTFSGFSNETFTAYQIETTCILYIFSDACDENSPSKLWENSIPFECREY